MQYTDIFFSAVKTKISSEKKMDTCIFIIFARNIDRGHILDPTHRGFSNKYPLSMFWIKKKKNNIPHVYPSINVGLKRVYFFMDMFS